MKKAMYDLYNSIDFGYLRDDEVENACINLAGAARVKDEEEQRKMEVLRRLKELADERKKDEAQGENH